MQAKNFVQNCFSFEPPLDQRGSKICQEKNFFFGLIWSENSQIVRYHWHFLPFYKNLKNIYEIINKRNVHPDSLQFHLFFNKNLENTFLKVGTEKYGCEKYTN